jgi:DNA topoisomerase-1
VPIKKLVKKQKKPEVKKKEPKKEKKVEKKALRKMQKAMMNDELDQNYDMSTEAQPLKATKKNLKWWTQSANETDNKWESLIHNGVIFPPAYEPLPSHVKVLYEGKPVTLSPEAEECCVWYAQKVGTPHTEKTKFNENFFREFKKVLGSGHVIQKFAGIDFMPVRRYLDEQKEIRKELMKTSESKKAVKAEKDRLDGIYGYALVDGMLQKVANYRVEPPGLFLGRGDHPKTGMFKVCNSHSHPHRSNFVSLILLSCVCFSPQHRIRPEDVTINIAKGEKAPPAPPGHRWKGLIHNKKVTWLAFWKDNINDHFKYVFLHASSLFKGQSDWEKYEKARELKKHIGKIRADYTRDLESQSTSAAQRATAMYLIDQFALRVGNEKDTSEEADTVGCCSLRLEHVNLTVENEIEFDFLGKDSMRYHNTVKVIPQVYKNFKRFTTSKKPTDDVFDRLTTSDLNEHLSKLMPGLTAKVFRTYNASVTLERELANPNNVLDPSATIDEKIAFYNRANREVAILCNHQRTVPKSHDLAMKKMEQQTQELHDKKKWIENQFDAAEGKKKRHSNKRLVIKRTPKPQAAAASASVVKVEEFDEEEVEMKEDKYLDDLATERGWKAPSDKAGVKAALAKLDERIKVSDTRMQVKEDNKAVALGTSKINYMDPRISVAWCKLSETPIEKVFNKSLLGKFPWSMEVPMDWKF